jgi:glycosyltransferase involved in cell wall biosynthesis
MPDLQVAMDAGLVPLSRAKLFEGARPAKMFEIMAVGRPVLLCGRGEAQRVLEATPGGPAGLISAPEDPQELARQIRHLAGDRRLALEMGARGRAYVFASFDREPIARRIEELATSVLGSRAT